MTPPRPSIDQPEEGHYKMRLVRGGPWVPVKIWYAAETRSENQTPSWRCTVNHLTADVWEVWPRVGGRGITEAEYRKLLPHPSPTRPIDKMRTKPVF
jgi:hypothetical protein